ncbi:exosortase/archaeosortase family protein [Blastococcus sp. TML/C7B]|uniref:exosortase/archaeosortase family protein n=1 Tax=Blastococcus sp. TML/C7B TaxID=2798728 RepID=UPI00190D130E|nr:exosortase/archaeosortase family protein [Blastococcus sp. TML/C7B]MBN1095031.1 exosortase/archaeosortase family protein [Blastococcus sp. TML/C7B]
MTSVAADPAPAVSRRAGLVRRGSARRLFPVALDLVLAALICFVGFRYLTDPLRELEALGLAQVVSWIEPGRASDILPGHVLLFPERGGMIDAVVTASCSSILSVLGLTALTAVILRGRKLHAVAGLLVAVAALLVLNHVRLLLSALAGMWWSDAALVLFHDWVGTLWNLAATLGGFLLMVWFALPTLERAEQDVAGRHTARRPDSWARPGLGYRAPEVEEARKPGRRRTSITGLLHRYVYPARLSAWLGARREAGRIDYRIGHLPVSARIARVRALVSDGLGAHPASLVAVASYDEDPLVLDALAQAVAARQWEPVTNHRVAALRLWARGWLLARGPGNEPDDPVHAVEEPHLLDGTVRIPAVTVTRMAVPPPPPTTGPDGLTRHRRLSFARPLPPQTPPGDAS